MMAGTYIIGTRGQFRPPNSWPPWSIVAYNGGNNARIGLDMPSLIRLLTVIGILAGLVFAGIWSLANLIQPEMREITITIPSDRIGK